MQRVALPGVCCAWRALRVAAAARPCASPSPSPPPLPLRAHAFAACVPPAHQHLRLRGRALPGASARRCFRARAAAAAGGGTAAAGPAAEPLPASEPPPNFILVDALPLMYKAHFAFEGARARVRRRAHEEPRSALTSRMCRMLSCLCA
jgi:hypothetical protein